MCYIVIPWVQWWVDMSVECCRIPQPHRLDGMKTTITGVQTFDFSIEADEWRRQSTKQAYIAQTSCTYLSSVFVTQAHLDNLETITNFPNNGINFSSLTNIFIVSCLLDWWCQCREQHLLYPSNPKLSHWIFPRCSHLSRARAVTGIYSPRALAHLINIPHILSGDTQCSVS